MYIILNFQLSALFPIWVTTSDVASLKVQGVQQLRLIVELRKEEENTLIETNTFLDQYLFTLAL